MKNFFISLVLLFGVALFTPQIILGESTNYKLEQQRLPRTEQERVEKWEISCVSKKKEQLPKEYTGPNLKLIEFSRTRLVDTIVVIKVTANGERIFTPIESGTVNCVWSENEYYIDVEKINEIETKNEKSLICDCKEYVGVFGSKGYEVTDVPIGSYLKLVPETKEMQVLPPTEETYNEIFEKQRKKQEIMNKRREEAIKAEKKRKAEMLEREKEIEKNQKKEKIKNIIAIVLTVLGFIIIIGIIAKNIFKKFKRK